MEIKSICEMHSRNLLESAVVAPANDSGEWLLFVRTVAGEEETVTRIRSVEQKTYKSVRGALADAKKIGFAEVTVKLTA